MRLMCVLFEHFSIESIVYILARVLEAHAAGSHITRVELYSVVSQDLYIT